MLASSFQKVEMLAREDMYLFSSVRSRVFSIRTWEKKDFNMMEVTKNCEDHHQGNVCFKNCQQPWTSF